MRLSGLKEIIFTYVANDISRWRQKRVPVKVIVQWPQYLIIEINSRKRNLNTSQPVALKSLMNIRGLLAIILERGNTTKQVNQEGKR